MNNKEYKMWLEKRGKIKCSYCPYNRGENKKRSPRRSWKSRTKQKRQFKN